MLKITSIRTCNATINVATHIIHAIVGLNWYMNNPTIAINATVVISVNNLIHLFVFNSNPLFRFFIAKPSPKYEVLSTRKFLITTIKHQIDVIFERLFHHHYLMLNLLIKYFHLDFDAFFLGTFTEYGKVTLSTLH